MISPFCWGLVLCCHRSLNQWDGLTLAGHQVSTKATLSLPFLSWTGGEKCHENLVGWAKGREITPQSSPQKKNRHWLSDINLIYYRLIQHMIIRNKTKKLKPPHSHPSLLSGLYSQFLTLLSRAVELLVFQVLSLSETAAPWDDCHWDFHPWWLMSWFYHMKVKL